MSAQLPTRISGLLRSARPSPPHRRLEIRPGEHVPKRVPCPWAWRAGTHAVVLDPVSPRVLQFLQKQLKQRQRGHLGCTPGARHPPHPPLPGSLAGLVRRTAQLERVAW